MSTQPDESASTATSESLSSSQAKAGGEELPVVFRMEGANEPWTTWRTVVRNRTVDNHPFLNQTEHMPCPGKHTENFCFVVGADTQLGINSQNVEWQTEIDYCIHTIEYINKMEEKPAFLCICGDIVDMEPDDYKNGTKEERKAIQTQQFEAFKKVWLDLDTSIPLVCLCGNHDVGNKPSEESIARYKTQLGDDYFAFWCKGCYNIVLNSNLYFDKSNAPQLHAEQHVWVRERLAYAKSLNARKIFVFAHHPWFMNDENDQDASLSGGSPIFGGKIVIPDAYFFIKYEERRELMEMFREYNVTACFSGHYHQNLVSKSSWGMHMIVTGPICNWLLESNAKDISNPENVTEAGGLRIVRVDDSLADGFSHRYELISSHGVKSFP